MTSTQTIRFCEYCENKLYHTIESSKESDSLTYFCRVCQKTNNDIIQDGICVLNIQYEGNQEFENITNKYTKYDPTLPHIELPCPNEKCKTKNNADSKSDIIYLRYDNVNMKHLYMCTTCDITWKSNT